MPECTFWFVNKNFDAYDIKVSELTILSGTLDFIFWSLNKIFDAYDIV